MNFDESVKVYHVEESGALTEVKCPSCGKTNWELLYSKDNEAYRMACFECSTVSQFLKTATAMMVPLDVAERLLDEEMAKLEQSDNALDQWMAAFQASDAALKHWKDTARSGNKALTAQIEFNNKLTEALNRANVAMVDKDRRIKRLESESRRLRDDKNKTS